MSYVSFSPTVCACLGKWDEKRQKNKSFWQNFRKSQKGVMRQNSKGMFLFCKYSLSTQHISDRTNQETVS